MRKSSNKNSKKSGLPPGTLVHIGNRKTEQTRLSKFTYNEENFEFKILANCSSEYLIKLEQWYIDNLKPEYNVCKIAGSCLGVKRRQESIDKKRQTADTIFTDLFQKNKVTSLLTFLNEETTLMEELFILNSVNKKAFITSTTKKILGL